MAVTRVVIDCDPGVDDAIAILLALASPEIDVLAITTVSGNAPLPTTTRNALRVLELAQQTDVPVAAGCDRPLVVRPAYPASSHGGDGLGDVDLPAPTATPVAEHAIDLMARLGQDRPFTLVAIGPLTNVALLLARYPQAPAWLERVVIMGGAAREGNVTPAAEFNIWADPEAAARVFDAGLDITAVPLDVTHQAFLDDTDLDRLGTRQGVAARTVASMLEGYRASHLIAYGSTHMPMHDPLAVYAVIDPRGIETSRAHVTVDCGPGPSRGATIIDRHGFTGEPPNAAVGWSVDRRAFVDLLIERLSSLP